MSDERELADRQATPTSGVRAGLTRLRERLLGSQESHWCVGVGVRVDLGRLNDDGSVTCPGCHEPVEVTEGFDGGWLVITEHCP